MTQLPPPVPDSYELLGLGNQPSRLNQPMRGSHSEAPHGYAVILEGAGVQYPTRHRFMRRRHVRRGVHSVSCAIPVGSLCVITGANGAGKSTLLRGLATLLPIASGTVTLFGQNDLSNIQRRELLSYSGDRLGIYDEFTVRELLEFFAHAFGVEPQRARQLIGLIEHRLHLQGDTEVVELSLGQRQRLSLARSLLHEAPLLLVDEPTNALDIDMASVVRQLLVELTGLGLTIIACTHDDHLIARASHQLHLVDGTLQGFRDLQMGHGHDRQRGLDVR